MSKKLITLLAIMLLSGTCRSFGTEPTATTRPLTDDENRAVIGPVLFNGDWIKSRWKRNEDSKSTGQHRPVNFDDPDSILRHVLLSSPPTSDVLPSERYYYYQFLLDGRLVSGNIRFADVEDEIVHIGYFDYFSKSKIGSRTYRPGDKIDVDFDRESQLVTISADGVTRNFRLSSKWNEGVESLPLLEGEQSVSGVLDESGYYLWLIYNEELRQFYYLLNKEQPLPERIDPFEAGWEGQGRLYIGADSRFVFYSGVESNRLVLVAVHEDEIRANSYYDGPFDQVPPRLSIKSMLEEAYPYVKYRGGIDEHGNFITLDSQRVAISPYQSYVAPSELITQLAELETTGPISWQKMTYEPKSNFHGKIRESSGFRS